MGALEDRRDRRRFALSFSRARHPGFESESDNFRSDIFTGCSHFIANSCNVHSGALCNEGSAMDLVEQLVTATLATRRVIARVKSKVSLPFKLLANGQFVAQTHPSYLNLKSAK